MTGFFNGVFLGAGVVISRLFGAGEEKQLKRTVHTTVLFAGICGLLVTAVGVFVTPEMLVWMKTPPSVLEDAIIYLRIYFCGAWGIVLFNAVSGIFQAVGDSKSPLFFLIIASITNVVLDVFLIAIMGFGIEGAAYATIFSQILSAVLALWKLSRTTGSYQLEWRRISLDSRVFWQILQMGIPAGLENSVTSVSHVLIQTFVNMLGASAAAGYGIYSKIDLFIYIPIACISQSLCMFIGQNTGAGKRIRSRNGTKAGILLGMGIGGVCALLSAGFAPVLVKFFNTDPEVLYYGTISLRVTMPFYFLLAFSVCMSSVLRGTGRTIAPMLVTLGCWCLFRVGYIFALQRTVKGIAAVLTAFPAAWILSSGIFLFLYLWKIRKTF